VIASGGVNRDTTTRVRKLSGIDMIPGFVNGIGAVVGSNPYSLYKSGDRAISNSDETMPIITEAVIPLEVVRFQKRSITMDGRLADAATAKARPTRNVTFIPLKRIPNTMAMNPTTKADILPARIFWRSSIRRFIYLSIKS
jgi:hypothetical protein